MRVFFVYLYGVASLKLLSELLCTYAC